MENVEILRRANEIVAPYGLSAEFLEGAYSVGVQGDYRTYTQIINLRGRWRKAEILRELSKAICNSLPVNRVTWEIPAIKVGKK